MKLFREIDDKPFNVEEVLADLFFRAQYRSLATELGLRSDV